MRGLDEVSGDGEEREEEHGPRNPPASSHSLQKSRMNPRGTETRWNASSASLGPSAGSSGILYPARITHATTVGMNGERSTPDPR